MLADPSTSRPRLNWYGSPAGHSLLRAVSVLEGSLTGPLSAKMTLALTPAGIGRDIVPIWKVPPIGLLALTGETTIVSTSRRRRALGFWDSPEVSKRSVPSIRKAWMATR